MYNKQLPRTCNFKLILINALHRDIYKIFVSVSWSKINTYIAYSYVNQSTNINDTCIATNYK